MSGSIAAYVGTAYKYSTAMKLPAYLQKYSNGNRTTNDEHKTKLIQE